MGAALVTLALVPVGRAWFEGRTALLATDRALRAGEGAKALHLARDAAGWWLPGSPFAEGAFARMRHIGHTAEVGGDVPAAVGAWRRLRASAARVRWPSAQLEADAAQARAALARLEASDPAREPARAPAGRASAPTGEPEPGAAAAALATLGGLVIFALGAAAFVRRGAGEGLRAGLAARWPFALAAAGLALAAFGFGWG